MTKKQIKNILRQAINRFLENEQHLLSVAVNERSLTHKFAEYLQIILGCAWDIDCEYNRYGEDSKILDEVKSIVGDNTKTYETKSKTVYPDIVVHKRGPDGPNLIVLEAKKDPTSQEKSDDKKKLRKIKEKYHYDFAIFLTFRVGQKQIKYEFIQ